MKNYEKYFVVGAGVVGCSISLELARRGAQVTLIERDTALQAASYAAAGMLAAEDPHNPPSLRHFSEYSLDLYEDFLSLIEHYSGTPVTYQTTHTWQYAADGSRYRLAERSLDPRELAHALRQAIIASPVELREHTHELPSNTGSAKVVYTAGAWSGDLLHVPIRPAKGQMLRVALPSGLSLHEVHRSEHVYIVPRTHGPQAGTALIGATVEDAGFDTQVHQQDLEELCARAAKLVPELASENGAPMVQAWAGLRPSTVDGLPLMGQIEDRTFIAAGHFRNGILLAPGTAMVIADLVQDKEPSIDLAPFAPARFR